MTSVGRVDVNYSETAKLQVRSTKLKMAMRGAMLVMCYADVFLEPWRTVRFKSSHPPVIARQHQACSACIRFAIIIVTIVLQ